MVQDIASAQEANHLETSMGAEKSPKKICPLQSKGQKRGLLSKTVKFETITTKSKQTSQTMPPHLTPTLSCVAGAHRVVSVGVK